MARLMFLIGIMLGLATYDYIISYAVKNKNIIHSLFLGDINVSKK